MRLIDADALRATLDYEGDSLPAQVLKATFVKVLDAAPTISCEACEHRNTLGACTICRCGSEFERKAPC